MERQEKNKDQTAAVLKTDEVKRLYDVLESEETPFEANVRNLGEGKRLVTISTESQHITHFTDILNNCMSV